MNNEKLPRFRIYQAGKDYAAELENGKWRVIEHNEVNTYDQKPPRFQHNQMMTAIEIFDAGLFRLFTDIICTNNLLDGASTLDELIQKVHDFAKFLEDLARDGWFLTKDFENHHGRIIIGLKSEDD